MSATVTKVVSGRGAWSNIGGTLNSAGTAPGPYYKAPASGAYKDMPGSKGADAVKNSGTVDMNYFAVYMGVRAIQRHLGTPDDGVWGPNTDSKCKDWQKAHSLTADGICGPNTTKAMFLPLLNKSAGSDDQVYYCCRGHVGHESAWDPAAVGFQTPEDLGLCQINGPAHPDMSAQERLRPEDSLPWVARFVANNLAVMGNRVDGIAAYLLGTGGAQQWVKADRPTMFYGVDIDAYVSSVRKQAEA